MSGYIPDPHNAHRWQDVQLLNAVNECDLQGLIEALENEGGAAGSDELMNLMNALMRTHPSTEIVKSVGRGGGNPEIEELNIDWLAAGLPQDFRGHLVLSLRSGEFLCRKKKRAGAVGRPSQSPFSPEVIAGSRIATLQREGKLTEQQAIDSWILESRNGRKLRNRTEVETWSRKARRARAAWADIEAIAREIDD